MRQRVSPHHHGPSILSSFTGARLRASDGVVTESREAILARKAPTADSARPTAASSKRSAARRTPNLGGSVDERQSVTRRPDRRISSGSSLSRLVTVGGPQDLRGAGRRLPPRPARAGPVVRADGPGRGQVRAEESDAPAGVLRRCLVVSGSRY